MGDDQTPKDVPGSADMMDTIKDLVNQLQDNLDQIDPKIKALRTEQNISLQNAIANKELNDAVINAERAGVSYERAIQLEESGKYIAEMQERVLQRNRQALGGINADIMTAKRIATVNQQNTIHANNVTDYMQTSIIFLCVAIVVMFIFGMAMNFFKRFIAHPVVIMQVLLIVLATIYIIVILYKVITNTNHYNMLYQERVFPYYAFDNKVSSEECDCPDEAKTNEPESSSVSNTCESATSLGDGVTNTPQSLSEQPQQPEVIATDTQVRQCSVAASAD